VQLRVHKSPADGCSGAELGAAEQRNLGGSAQKSA